MNKIIESFKKRYNSSPSIVTSAPGRLEILGNHTDYNEGFVLSMAVDKSADFAVAPTDSKNDICTVYDAKFDEIAQFSLKKLLEHSRGDWINYIKGVLVEMQKRGVVIPPFQAVLSSNVPLSAGMSSSAAFEMVVAYAIGKLTKTDFDYREWAKIGRDCENNYVGANTGLLDQISSIKGLKDHLIFTDFRSVDVKNVPIDKKLSFVVANSMVKHDLTTEYNERRENCENVAKIFASKYENVTTLRDVTEEMLEEDSKQLDFIDYKRAKHVIGENRRVLQGIKYLEKKDVTAFGNLMSESHESSRINFENSCDELDVLVELGKTLPGHLGARLSGGGFGGISVHLVENQHTDTYCERLATAFKTRTSIEIEPIICIPGDGVKVSVL
ncbi:MAG: galactokinase [Verrucomicrobiota bacterium]|nr:galactokinase [Verrucomicrobiota bacterium]